MKQKTKINLKFLFALLAFVAALLCSLFFMLKNDVSKAYADVSGYSGLNFYFTTPGGTSNGDIFFSNGSSTLAYSEFEAVEYINQNGQITNEFQCISGNTNSFFSDAVASGQSKFSLSQDMKLLATQNLLHVRLSVGILSLNNKSQSKVECKISYTNKSGQLIEKVLSDSNVHSNGTYSPLWQQTEFIQIDNPDSEITFSFKSGEGSVWSPAKFMIFEPKLEFEVALKHTPVITAQKTNPHKGEMIALLGENDVTKLSSNSEFLSYLKKLFKVDYTITSGSQYAYIYQNRLCINSNAPHGSKIEIWACSYQSTHSSLKTFSSKLTFVVDNTTTKLNVTSNFPDAATIYGDLEYYNGETASLYFDKNEGYEFVGWSIDGEIVSQSDNLQLVINKNKVNVLAVFKKHISISDVVFETKIYDGTTSVQIKQIVLDDTNGYEVWVDGLVMEFDNANAGESKAVLAVSIPMLAGKDKDYFVFNFDKNFSAFHSIKKRIVDVEIDDNQKIYSQPDPEFSAKLHNVLSKDQHLFKLCRTNGENVGTYEITLHSTEYANYTANIVKKGVFTIIKRQIELPVRISDKVYDGTNIATISFNSSLIPNFDNSLLSYQAKFENENVGVKIAVSLASFKYSNNNLSIKTSLQNKWANITAKPIKVVALNSTITYGDNCPVLNYQTEGLVAGDNLDGQLKTTYEKLSAAGEYAITLGSLSGSNYEITFTPAKIIVEKRPLTITISQQYHKIYGEKDPIFAIEAPELLPTDVLQGSISRESGEDVGKYSFNLGSLTNENYSITLQESFFDIRPKQISLEIKAHEKVYDGTLNCQYSYQFVEVLPFDKLTCSATLNFATPDAENNVEVIISNVEIYGNEKSNYNIEFNLSSHANILQKDIVINIPQQSFVYGDSIDIKYFAEGVVDGQKLLGEYKIESNEVGKYIPFSSKIKELNPNYNILTTEFAPLIEILPRPITIKVNDATKYYLDKDPDFSACLCNQSSLAYDDKLEDLIAYFYRQDLDDKVGTYQVFVKCKDNANYSIKSESGILTIEKRMVNVVVEEIFKSYGQPDPSTKYTTDLPYDLQTLFNFTRTPGEQTGKYEISLVSCDNPNLELNCKTNYLNIIPKDVLLTPLTTFKYYGQSDPTIHFQLDKTALVFEQDMQMLVGQLARDSGENVGEYKITLGTLTLGPNYNLILAEQMFVVLKNQITISPKTVSKVFASNDPVLTYKATLSGHINNFSPTINISREPGENVGKYPFHVTCDVDTKNFEVVVEDAHLEITPKPIEIVVQDYQIEYGQTLSSIEFEVVGADASEFVGKMECEVDVSCIQNVGIYKILCNLKNSNYTINYQQKFVEIYKKNVNVNILDSFKIYGECDPALRYEIDDEYKSMVLGSLSRIAGEDVGEYKIISNLSLGSNYNLVVQNPNQAKLYISPKHVSIIVATQSKIYHDTDPKIIVSCDDGLAIQENIDLTKFVEREQGETVGTYHYFAKDHINFVFELQQEAYLKITPRDVYLIATANDKVFDNSTKTTISTPIIKGLFDNEIVLEYHQDNHADFEDSEIGSNKKVYLHDITLAGSMSENYNLILPVLSAKITRNEITLENGVKINAHSSTAFDMQSVLTCEKIAANDFHADSNQKVISAYNFKLNNNSNQKVGQVSFEFDINTSRLNNLRAYLVDENGNKTLLNTQQYDKKLVVFSQELGRIVIVAENELWIEILAIISTSLLISVVLFIIIKKYKRKSKK